MASSREDVVVLTPTRNQPTGLRLLDGYLRRQTFQDFTWVVVDDGEGSITPERCDHMLVHSGEGKNGAQSFLDNLAFGLDFIEARDLGAHALIFCEHDDWYGAEHVGALVDAIDTRDVVGSTVQRYYHVGLRRWRVYTNHGASSLSQTAMDPSYRPLLRRAIRDCRTRGILGVDAAFWGGVDRRHAGLSKEADHVVSIKGLPGPRGLGLGHRPKKVLTWNEDPDLEVLASWIGEEDAGSYAGFREEADRRCS